MWPNVQQKPAVGVLLLWILSCLAQSSGQEFCKQFALNQSLSFSDLQAIQEKLSACCWTAPNSCQVAGGFCIPAWLGRSCPQTNDALCGGCGCTCCLDKTTPAPCTGTCGTSTRKGNCRSSCNALEESIPGECLSRNCKCCAEKTTAPCTGTCGTSTRRGYCRSSCSVFEESIPGVCLGGNCKCCARNFLPGCNGICSKPYHRCVPERECFMRKRDVDGLDLIPIDSCGSPGCACCPFYDYEMKG
ncbi:keratin-associated protein 5-1-like [Penaeus indicus]|uniref:keratin-associated protein 5-1-like n=1 Tax=Penaeus indicus TaxID=29960 RepID=UPI00300D3806